MSTNITRSQEEELKVTQRKNQIVWGLTFALPAQYIFSRRNQIYKATKEVRGYYVKEIIMRFPIGYMLGLGISLSMYGLSDPKPKKHELDENGEVMAKDSVKYSVVLKKQNMHYVPGRLRDD